MSSHYLYNVEFTVDDYNLWTFPNNMQNPEDHQTIIRFTMKPSVCLEICDDEFIDQVNCSKKHVKNSMFSLNDNELNSDLGGKLAVYKVECMTADEVSIGEYKMKNMEDIFKKLAEEYDKHSERKSGNIKKKEKRNQPTFHTSKQLVQVVNEKDHPCGSILYSLQIICFGPSITNSESSSDESKSREIEYSCLERGITPTPCRNNQKVSSNDQDFQEYSAEINGNQLIIRVHKEDQSHLVTRVFDSSENNDNVVSVCGCQQQIDFKFPNQFSCNSGKICEAKMTNHQRKTSCAGKSFKNSLGLPVIRGNLKYPGRLDGSINFDLVNKENFKNVKNYEMKQRGVCCQVDSCNLQREIEGKCKIPQGIQVCKKGCEADSDVFILKIGHKNANKCGKQNAIELEMRTPKGPENERKQMETRQIQVEEKELIENLKNSVKIENEEVKKPTTNKSETKSGKKVEVKTTRGFIKKKLK